MPEITAFGCDDTVFIHANENSGHGNCLRIEEVIARGALSDDLESRREVCVVRIGGGRGCTVVYRYSVCFRFQRTSINKLITHARQETPLKMGEDMLLLLILCLLLKTCVAQGVAGGRVQKSRDPKRAHQYSNPNDVHESNFANSGRRTTIM